MQGRDIEAGGSSSALLDFSPLLSLRAGQIYGSDGSSLPQPVLSRSVVESAEYVPRRFAQERLDAAAAEYRKANAAYKENVRALKDSYETLIKESQANFEALVTTMKTKAQRHVAVQRELRKQSEDALNQQLQQQNGLNEELRDKLAAMNLQQQELRKQNATVKFQIVGLLNIHTKLKDKMAQLAIESAQREAEVLRTSREVELQSQSQKLQHSQQLLVSDAGTQHRGLADALHVSYCLTNLVVEVERECATKLVPSPPEKWMEENAERQADAGVAVENLVDISPPTPTPTVLSKIEIATSATQTDPVVVLSESSGPIPASPTAQSIVLSTASVVSASAAVSSAPIVSAAPAISATAATAATAAIASTIDATEGADVARTNGAQLVMLQELETLKSELAALDQQGYLAQYDSRTEELAEIKSEAKERVKQWLLNFEAEHQRKPTDEEKAMADPLFAAYKEASSALQEFKAEHDAQVERSAQVQLRIKTIEENLQSQAPTAPASLSAEQKQQQEAHTALLINSTIQQLEDKVSDLTAALDGARAQLVEAEESKTVVANQFALLVAEKRTDVLKSLSEENITLRNHVGEMNESLASLKAAASKAESRMSEFKLRAEQAEANVRTRDAAAMASLPQGEEILRLRKELAKQSEELINRSKAVTAGWDAAANAEEKAEIEIAKARDVGFREGSSRVSKDLDRLNLALEEKEVRIQELILEAGEMDAKVKESEQRVSDAEKRAKEAALEVADTIAALGVGDGDGGGGGAGGGVSEAEFDRVRGELDDAQEEIVTLQERIDELEAQAALSEQTIAVYDQLKTLSENTNNKGKSLLSTPGKSKTSAGDTPGGEGGVAAGSSSSHLSEVMILVKNAITKGSGLWKVNTPQKKDECLALYRDTLENCARLLSSPTLVDPVKEVLSSAGSSSDAAKWVPILRKALEKLQSDGKIPGNVRGEATAATALSGSAATDTPPATATAVVASEGGVVRELEIELRALRRQIDYRAKREDDLKKQLANKTSASGLPDSVTGSILKRAQQAERQVEILKKQIRALAQPKVSAPGAALVAFDATAIELRRCQRKIKALEGQLACGDSGGVAGGGERRAQILAEKQAAKKLKDLEVSNKKELKALEARAAKAETGLKEAKEALQPAKDEIDTLKARVKGMLSLGAVVETLRSEVATLQEVKDDYDRLEAELARVSQTLVVESGLRKKYKNELEDLKGAIRVYARCRPMARYEIDKGCSSVVTFKDETSLSVASSRGKKEFEFDAVYDPNSKQEQVFEDTKRLVESCIDGFNTCIFAYGQTGSGKTHTLTGSAELPGLTPRVIDEVFRLIELKGNCVITVRSYFLELYLDTLIDLYQLLDSKRASKAAAAGGGGGGGGGIEALGPPKLEIKMDEKRMVYIKNSVVKDVSSPEELMTLFRDGNKERHTGATLMNAESSRSHSIFAILIESFDKTTRKTLVGKISLVDLAGSERADKTGATGERFKEGQAINKSLSALGNVISALSEGKKNVKVPYRDNKLTMLMQDSIGGNAKTLMFVNVSPADYNSDETVQSLNYAARVKKIVNSAAKGVESAEVARLKAIIRKLGGAAALDDGPAAEEGGGDPDENTGGEKDEGEGEGEGGEENIGLAAFEES